MRNIVHGGIVLIVHYRQVETGTVNGAGQLRRKIMFGTRENTDKYRGKNMQAGLQSGYSKVHVISAVAVAGLLVIIGGLLFFSAPVRKADAIAITVYKSPTCNCCSNWVDHMRDAGFVVTAENRTDLENVKRSAGVPSNLQSCHTALVDGYIIEGHVPASDIKRLLQERPAVTGLAVPGMPMGSPGMEGPYRDPYDVLVFDRAGRTRVYSSY